MGIIKEVRVFIQEFERFKLEFRNFRNLIESYQKLVDRLEKQNATLMDRLMSRGLPEFKTFSTPDGDVTIAERSNPLDDEELAGMVVDIPEEDENS
jgi:hypothetical protein